MPCKAHYLELATKSVQLFGIKEDKLPLWFKKRDWGVNVDCKLTSFLPPDLGLLEVEAPELRESQARKTRKLPTAIVKAGNYSGAVI